MYKMNLWDEDKWNIHSSSYSSSKYSDISHHDGQDNLKYHEQKYNSIEKNDDEKTSNSGSGFSPEEEDNDANAHSLNQDALSQGEITFKAAKQMFHEVPSAKKIVNPAFLSIDDAIKKASQDFV